jgi:sigma-B regulation protein RsbU (phosphoserine phosphatase)
VLTTLNAHLTRLIEPGWFVTACYAVLDPSDGRLEYALAGHPPPLLVRNPSRTLEPLACGAGAPLGVIHDARFTSSQARMAPGDSLLFFTDGLIEALDSRGEFFGVERVMQLLAEHGGSSARTILERILTELERHTGARIPADDVTLLILRACGS